MSKANFKLPLETTIYHYKQHYRYLAFMKYALFIIGLILSSNMLMLNYISLQIVNLWDTISPNSLGWAQNKIDNLHAFLDSNNTKAFILLKDGKIVLEEYFNGHDSTSNWYWASTGKSLTAFLIGIAQQENYLNVNDTTSTY